MINLTELKIKNEGFGRTEYDALKTALMNLFEQLCENEKFVYPIKESLKIFIRKINDKKESEKIDNIFKFKKDFKSKSTSPQKEIIVQNIFEKNQENKIDNFTINKKGLKISKGESFNIIPKNTNYSTLEKLREDLKEKDLIILELEKLVIDMMNQNKVKILIKLENSSNLRK